jgi:hypothetical protein
MSTTGNARMMRAWSLVSPSVSSVLLRVLGPTVYLVAIAAKS